MLTMCSRCTTQFSVHFADFDFASNLAGITKTVLKPRICAGINRPLCKTARRCSGVGGRSPNESSLPGKDSTS